MATDEIRVLAQSPVKVLLGGIEIEIHPPTSYRLNQINGCAKNTPTNDINTDKLIGNYDILRLICKTKDVFVNDQLVEGVIPAHLMPDEFWRCQVQTAEIAALLEVFVDLIDIDKLLKKAVALGRR